MAVSAFPLAAESARLRFECTVAAYGLVEATPAALPALRREPGPSCGRTIPPRFLRHADEQTVVGLAAVLKAIDGKLRQTCFDDWGVLAAPQFPGRIAAAATLASFREGGPAKVSPHAIPQLSLHSASGAISIALGMRGPSFGVGGGRDALTQGLTAAVTLLDRGLASGLWLVLTQWTPEPVPDSLGLGTQPTICRGVALALLPGGRQGLARIAHQPNALQHSVPLLRRSSARRNSAAHDGQKSALLLRLTCLERNRRVGGGATQAECPTAASKLTELAEWLSAYATRQEGKPAEGERPEAANAPLDPDPTRSAPDGHPGPWSCSLPWGGEIELIAG